jgi:hypothetical protein
LPQSSSASRFTAGASAFFILSQSGAAGTIGGVFPLRDNAFKAELAGVTKHGLAVAYHVLVETNAWPSLGQGSN